VVPRPMPTAPRRDLAVVPRPKSMGRAGT
jgi:hypothetical protein